MLVAWTTGRGSGDLSQETQLIKVSWIPPFLPPPISQVTDPKPAHGGGGGGDNTAYPSAGQLPQWRLEPPVVAPTPETPINAPSLAVLETLLADPRFQPKRDDLTPTGLPDGVPGPPAAGPGSGRGLGSGNGGGAGPGKGPGIGEGEDGNFGGDTYGIGRPPNGRSSSQPAVDSRPVLLNNPRPLYTEEARVRKVQGVVKVRLLVGADGSVKEVVVKSGLPNGLTEQAIRAAYQMRFTPAIRGGVPVSYWLANVVIEFNIR
jgi:protein TonB